MFKNLLFAVCLLSSFLCAGAETMPHPFKILPEPQKITLTNGAGFAAASLRYLLVKGDVGLPVLPQHLSQLARTQKEGKGTLILILDSTLSDVTGGEGYRMNISADKIVISAKGNAGLFYGCQSLEQLLEDADEYKKSIPSATITDYPALTYRAVHFDLKHHLDHMNYYYESIDRLARYKINAIVFEFEDKLRYQRQPLVGAPQSISLEEMAALTSYARERFIEITPLVQGLGHASFILKHEEYAGLRELPWNSWAFCPLNEGTYQVLFDLYRDAIKATPGSKYLHIGGDEIGNIGLCPRCKPQADKEGMISLNLYWLRRVCEFAKENNRTPIFWDDMPLQYAGLYKTTWSDEVGQAEADAAWKTGRAKLDSLQTDFPKNCIYMRWNYSMAEQPGNLLALDWYKSHHLTSMIATATNSGGGMFFEPDVRDAGKSSSGIITIKNFIELAAEKKISGMLCTAWDDRSPHIENYWRGFIASAEYSWHPKGRTLEQYDEAWMQKEFGLPSSGYSALRQQLSSGSDLWYKAFFKTGNLFDDDNALQSLKRVEHWLPPLEGAEKLQFDYTTKLIALPDLKNPGAWSQKYKDRLDEAEVAMRNNPGVEKKLSEVYNASRRNRYSWELSQRMYDFQTTAPRLLLALKQCDNADVNKQKAGLAQVRKALTDYQRSWTELESAYSKTRFIAYPDNYLPDRYFHVASQAEDLTWMIQADKMYHGMITQWLETQKSTASISKN